MDLAAVDQGSSTNLTELLGQQEAQMNATMEFQSQSAQMSLEFQMHEAATERLNAMTASIGRVSQQASQALAQ